ncbi:hypothetical protein Tco_0567594 [Tanacetum coccineum]
MNSATCSFEAAKVRILNPTNSSLNEAEKTAVVTAVTTADAIGQMVKTTMQVTLMVTPALDTPIECLRTPSKQNPSLGRLGSNFNNLSKKEKSPGAGTKFEMMEMDDRKVEIREMAREATKQEKIEAIRRVFNFSLFILIILDMDPSRSWAPRWLNKEQSVFYLIIRRMKTNTNSGVVSVQPAEVVTSQQDTCNVVHVRDISENGQREIGKDHCFTSFAFEHVNRTKLQLNISLDRKIWNWTLIESFNLLEQQAVVENDVGKSLNEVHNLRSDMLVCDNFDALPRFKILASFMMPIARMLARIYTILAPYGTRPRPIFETDMEAIFQEMKEKQEASDKAFEEVRLKSLESDIVDKKSLSLSGKRVVTGKPTKRSRKPSGPILGSTVQIVSRTFTDFTGTIKKPDKKKRSGMHSPYVTIGLTWNDNIADLILSDIVDEQK